MAEQEDDLLKKAEEIIQGAWENSDVQFPVSPTPEVIKFFMGGADAGSVLIGKNLVDTDHTSQIHLKFLHDLNDLGDLGDLIHFLNEQGYTAINPHATSENNQPQLRGLPTTRVFFMHSGSLYTSTSQGMIPEDIQQGVSIETPVLVTSDETSATDLFRKISDLPDRSRGRDLFAVFHTVFQSNPSKFQFKQVHLPGAMISKQVDSMDYIITRGDEKKRKLLELWFDRFRGKIPAHWGIWYGITRDLEENEKLPEEWLDAAVTYNYWRVAQVACEHHRLNVEQMAIALVQFGKSRFNIEEAIDAQRNQGVTNEEIESAIEIAQNEGEKLIFKKLGQNQ